MSAPVLEIGGPMAMVPTDNGPGDTAMLMRIIERAANDPNFDLERITRLLDLKDRWEHGQALKAFAAAKVDFKSNPPVLTKNRNVSYGTTAYAHADHHEVTSKISAALAPHGLIHAWSIAQAANQITVTCTLTHVGGHSESVELSSINDGSGGKNSIQAIASANTYLQRYTLLAVTGLSVADMPDDDGKGAGAPKPDVDHDVWVSLQDASREGSSALAEAWRGLSDTVRAVIVLHYSDDWAQLKQCAASVGVTA